MLVSVSPRTQYVRPTALSPNAPFVIAFRPSSRLPPSRNRSRYLPPCVFAERGRGTCGNRHVSSRRVRRHDPLSPHTLRGARAGSHVRQSRSHVSEVA